MEKIPFKVSARTAKLIGQENFSNPEGATIELVKNCYDADAKNCLVVFDIVFAVIPEVLTPSDYKTFSTQSKIVKDCYNLKSGKYNIISKITEKLSNELRIFFFSHNSIYIIDNGDGMNTNTIKNYWMEIGTGNKEKNYVSDDGRVKTGAKGIGRFALDRLGSFAEMWTVSKDPKQVVSLYWSMDWKQFETPDRSISEIKAELGEQKINIKQFLKDKFKNNTQVIKHIQDKQFTSGTIIKISNLKDSWTERNLRSVYKSIEALVPPKELAIPFTVGFFHLQSPKLFGEVETAYFNDYDYKVLAVFDHKKLLVDITITRNEIDLKKVNKQFGHVFKNSKSPYDLKTLEKKTFKISKTAFELLKWKEDNHSKDMLQKLGGFSFTFYFLKTLTSQKEEYPYKNINSKERREIIEKFGGIKIYRDSFRVRPYGDIGNDWLRLGDRASASPAGAGQRVGDWRARSNQIAGLVAISRVANPNLVDKSDRGGLQENETFGTLQRFLLALISEFELDRSKILNPFYLDGQRKKAEERKAEIQAEAEKLADKIVKERAKAEEKVYGSKPDLFKSKKEEEEKKAYKKAIEETLEKFEKDDNKHAEIAQIRTLASLGLIVSSFAHELKEVKNNYNDINELENIFDRITPKTDRKTNDYKDGNNIIKALKEENKKISHWVDYSLTAIKKDKRKRSTIKFDKYFLSLNKNWKTVLENRNIHLEILNNINKAYTFRAFEMDLNTIFNNLISNSIDAFHSLKIIRDRKISIVISLLKNKIHILYTDNGSGIPTVFKKDIAEIFLPFTTSKKDREGNDIGTGLGMYLVKNVIEDNNGSVEIMDSKIGFKLNIEFPVRNT